MIRRTLALALLAAAPGSAGYAAAFDSTVPVYDQDYPFIHYSDPPVHNAIARLQRQLDDGSVKLEPSLQHGYLESMLKALNIDPDSQTLVFSKTSLQVDAISATTPRAVYFNDNTYVAWVQKTGILEIVTMDADRGPVFYTLPAADSKPQLQREAPRCLSCHDTFAELGGGVPHFLFESTYDVQNGKLIPDAVARETTDATPIAQRWGGWYVSGSDGGATHLGNIRVASDAATVSVDKVKRGSLASLDSLLDTSAYLRHTSDIVALLVLEHQVTVENQIIRTNYKSRLMFSRLLQDGDAATLHWAQLPPQLQQRLDLMLRPLVDSLLMAQSAGLPAQVAGGTGFSDWFEIQGTKDASGRSLRQLDLHARVFRYPLSYLIYSEGFDALPLAVREHVYGQLARILQAPDPGAPYASRSVADRHAAFEILAATKPEFTRDLAAVKD